MTRMSGLVRRSFRRCCVVLTFASSGVPSRTPRATRRRSRRRATFRSHARRGHDPPVPADGSRATSLAQALVSLVASERHSVLNDARPSRGSSRSPRSRRAHARRDPITPTFAEMAKLAPVGAPPLRMRAALRTRSSARAHQHDGAARRRRDRLDESFATSSRTSPRGRGPPAARPGVVQRGARVGFAGRTASNARVFGTARVNGTLFR